MNGSSAWERRPEKQSSCPVSCSPRWGSTAPTSAPRSEPLAENKVRIHVTNELTVPTTAHWHGMMLPASQDGTAHQSISPEHTWTAAWQIDQPAATLWYHPHPHGQTELQVGRGMAGLFLIDDETALRPALGIWRGRYSADYSGRHRPVRGHTCRGHPPPRPSGGSATP